LVDAFGRNRIVVDVAPDDFAKLRAKTAKRLGPVSLGNFIQRVRAVFKFGFDSGLMEVPIRYGQGFDKPPKRVQRLHRALAGRKLVAAADAWALLRAAGSPLDAMILLGLNCGFGQGDCSELPRTALDMRPGWIDFPRPKTGIGRRAPLWPETVAALDRARASRPEPRDPADDRLVFLTTFGRPWVRFSDKGDAKRGARTDAVGQEFAKLCKRAGVKVPGGFYVFRHTFRTIADEVKDHAAIGLVMGHHDDSMAGYYRELVADERLQAVTDHVRAWLLAGKRLRCPPLSRRCLSDRIRAFAAADQGAAGLGRV
jgi:integrase